MKKALFPVILFLSMILILGSALTTFASRTTGIAIDDSAITRKVKYKLSDDLKSGTLKTVQVDTHRGEVTLTGNVHNQEQKELAELMVDNVDGVVRVHNMLSIVPEQ